MRRLMSLHFSLVVCYYDNKDPFDARRPFYLQISLLNVITMHVHKQACVRVSVCVCALHWKKPILVLSFLQPWRIYALYALSYCCTTTCFVFILIVTSHWLMLELLSVSLLSSISCLNKIPTKEMRVLSASIMADIHFIRWAPSIVLVRGHHCYSPYRRYKLQDHITFVSLAQQKKEFSYHVLFNLMTAAFIFSWHYINQAGLVTASQICHGYQEYAKLGKCPMTAEKVNRMDLGFQFKKKKKKKLRNCKT